MKCCDLICAATIDAARTSEVGISHQTFLQWALSNNKKQAFKKLAMKGSPWFQITPKIPESWIRTFINILVRLCNSLYIINRVTHTSKLGKQESPESSQKSWKLELNKDLESRWRKSVVAAPLVSNARLIASSTFCQTFLLPKFFTLHIYNYYLVGRLYKLITILYASPVNFCLTAFCLYKYVCI